MDSSSALRSTLYEVVTISATVLVVDVVAEGSGISVESPLPSPNSLFPAAL